VEEIPEETQEEETLVEEILEATQEEETLAEATLEATQEEEGAETHRQQEDNPQDSKPPLPSMENDSWVPLPSISKATAPEQKNSSTKLRTTSSSTTNISPSNRPLPE
jgi:hypothetical protein